MRWAIAFKLNANRDRYPAKNLRPMRREVPNHNPTFAGSFHGFLQDLVLASPAYRSRWSTDRLFPLASTYVA
ncbi:MAG: hypothetical protein CMJ28_03285 [Phycisphaerae bacterium]|nr:hypothetical protein [Phycisphaerae bacterium]